MSASPESLTMAMRMAIEAAEMYRGATAPNPPVGAVGLNEYGHILSVQAHKKAGTPHAEARVIQDCFYHGNLAQLHTLVVTLEPCNHTGRTPPCTEVILSTGIKRVIYGARDPNPRVAGGGAERLKQAGLEVLRPSDPELLKRSEELIEAFAHWSQTGIPWVTVKTAYTPQGSMIPHPGSKTFSSASSLDLAHRMRKRADAILTGSGTVLADQPEFTVRRVQDHADKKRWLILLDRRKRVPESWVEAARGRGFEVVRDLDLDQALNFLGEKGVLEVLVEAGPELTEAVMKSGIWNENVVIQAGTPDSIKVVKNVHWNHPKPRITH